jgi:glycosyltransferase involved in cell wall biosynthesis
MKLLFSLLDAQVGGGQQVASWLAEAAAARGHEIGLIVPELGPTSDRFEGLGGRTYLARLQRLRQPGDVPSAARILRDFDVLWSHTAIGGQLLGELAARTARRPHVIHQHAYPHFASRQPAAAFQHLLCRVLLGRRHFIAVAPHVKDGLISVGTREDRVHVVQNGVPILPAAPPADVPPVKIGLLGRIDPGKGMLEFVEAAKRTGLTPEEATFTVGGSRGPFVGYEADVRTRAASAGVAVEEPGSDGVGFLATQDIIVMPSRYEGSPLTLLEAMALGKAVIASDIPGVTAITGQSEAVTLIPVGSVDALANAICELVGDRSRITTGGRIARDLVVQRFPVQSMTHSALDIVELVVKRENQS